MAIEEVMNVYGLNLTPDEIKERSTWHETTYLEYEIPRELEVELSKIIETKINEFENNCGCGRCQLHKR